MGKNAMHFFFWNTASDDLVCAVSIEEWFLPIVMLHIGEEFLLLMISEFRWCAMTCKIIDKICKPR